MEVKKDASKRGRRARAFVVSPGNQDTLTGTFAEHSHQFFINSDPCAEHADLNIAVSRILGGKNGVWSNGAIAPQLPERHLVGNENKAPAAQPLSRLPDALSRTLQYEWDTNG